MKKFFKEFPTCWKTIMVDYSLPEFSLIRTQNLFEKSRDKKSNLIKYQMSTMLRRNLKMFKWNNLPKTIDPRHLEIVLQLQGHVGFFEHNGKLYIDHGGLGGKPNWNYMPSNYIIANPYLELSKTFHIYDYDDFKKDIVVIPNDSLYQGNLDIMSYHSELLTEIVLTKHLVAILKRAPVAFTAPDNNAKKNVEEYIKKLADGDVTAILDKNFMRAISGIDTEGAQSNIMTQLLEWEQYQKAAYFNDFGLQLNYNMKRESITSSEAQLGEGSLLPLVDDMMERRVKGCEELNELFSHLLEGEASVEFDSSWKNLHKSIELEVEKEEAEVENLENPESSNALEEGEGGENNDERIQQPDGDIQEPKD